MKNAIGIEGGQGDMQGNHEFAVVFRPLFEVGDALIKLIADFELRAAFGRNEAFVSVELNPGGLVAAANIDDVAEGNFGCYTFLFDP